MFYDFKQNFFHCVYITRGTLYYLVKNRNRVCSTIFRRRFPTPIILLFLLLWWEWIKLSLISLSFHLFLFSTFPLLYSSNWTFLTFFCSYTQACDPIIHESLWKLGLFLHWRTIMGAWISIQFRIVVGYCRSCMIAWNIKYMFERYRKWHRK